MKDKEKRTARIVFWSVSPIMFAGLVRLFFLFFYFVFGMLLVWMFGVKYNKIILVLAILTSIFFTIATLVVLYRMFKTYILEE